MLLPGCLYIRFGIFVPVIENTAGLFRNLRSRSLTYRLLCGCFRYQDVYQEWYRQCWQKYEAGKRKVL